LAQFFSGFFYKRHDIHFSRKFKEKNVPVVSAFIHVSLFVYGIYHPSLPIFDALPQHQATTHTRVSPRTLFTTEFFRSHFFATCSLPRFRFFEREEDHGCSDGIFSQFTSPVSDGVRLIGLETFEILSPSCKYVLLIAE